jgi:hypothetical protein
LRNNQTNVPKIQAWFAATDIMPSKPEHKCLDCDRDGLPSGSFTDDGVKSSPLEVIGE